MEKQRPGLHLRSALLGGLVAALIVSALPAMAAQVGDALRLGESNRLNRQTILRGRAISNLTIISDAHGDTNGTALDLRVKPGNPPMKVNSSDRVDGLNADLLDGKHAGQFVSAQEDTFYYVPGSLLEIHFDEGPAEVFFDNSSNAIVRKTGSTGNMKVVIPVPLPAELGGRWGKLVNYRVSYKVDNVNSHITSTRLIKSSNTGEPVDIGFEPTDRKSTTYASYVVDCSDPGCQLDWVPNGNYLTVVLELQYGGIGDPHDITIGGVLLRVSYDG